MDDNQQAASTRYSTIRRLIGVVDTILLANVGQVGSTQNRGFQDSTFALAAGRMSAVHDIQQAATSSKYSRISQAKQAAAVSHLELDCPIESR